MSETEFLLFQKIIGVIEIFLYAVCLTAFFYSFMVDGKERRTSILKKVIIVFITYAAIFSAPISGWLCMIMVIALLVLALDFLEMDKGASFFFSIIFFCMRTLSGLIAESLSFISSSYLVSGIEEEEIILRNVAVNYVCCLIIRIILCYLMLYFVKKRLEKSKVVLEIQELYYLSILPIIGVLFGNIIFIMLTVIKDSTYFLLYEQYPILVGLVPLICILFYTGIFNSIVSYQEMIKLQEEKKKYFVEEQQVHAIRKRMEEVEQFYNGIRQMKHEMRNHLTNIKGLVESGSYEDVEQYIAKMDESMNVFEITIQTGNAVTDVIVNDKQKVASKQGIQFQSDFSYPASDRYDAYDLGIIINNLLQNALEACVKMKTGERYVTLSGKQKRKFFLIEVRNSFDGEIIFDKSTNLPVSTKKKNVSIHGIGLSNVKREVEKYMGDIDMRLKKNEFCVTVLLQERRRGTDE